MALRFRKSIKLAPGLRMNFSGSGASWTLGPRGASVGIGKRGSYLNTGIPGTGLYSRERLGGGSPRAVSAGPTRQAASSTSSVQMTCGISDDGTLTFTGADGHAVPEHVMELAKRQNREAIQGLIQTKCDEINARVEVLGQLHYGTPDCKVTPQFRAPAFDVPSPVAPVPKVPRFFDKVFASRGAQIVQANSRAADSYDAARAAWMQKRREFDAQVAERKDFVEKLIHTDVAAMETFLAENLQDIAWPRETAVDFDISNAGAVVQLDVDLPELEDMPTQFAAVPSRGLKLSVKEMAAGKVQKLYSDHVYSITFRLIGEVFAALPTAQLVVLSGYSQRRSKSTGQLSNEYLVSVKAARADWQKLDFKGLESIEAVSALARFDLLCDQLKSGYFKAIAPLQA